MSPGGEFVPPEEPEGERMIDMQIIPEAPAHPRIAASNVLPVLFVLEHDPSALNVLMADLSRRFGNDFTVMGRTSPGAALTALQDLASAARAVALLLVDGGSSEDFLTRAHELHPRAKRVLLV